jgi:hypothetical protein
MIFSMTYPRAHLVDPAGGVYHVCSRCVRRAWLCGFDQLSGYNFDHRRTWLESRILRLSEIFAVDLFGYAVMSNHYHVVLQVDPGRTQIWSDEEIADRWLSLRVEAPPKGQGVNTAAIEKSALLEDPARLQVLRERLGSLSWFMRYVNEPLARLANKEDNCRGRFWEGRFKSQRLLDENAVLAAMIYVDLNPVRAGFSGDLRDSPCTSLNRRHAHTRTHAPMKALNRPGVRLPFSYSLGDYTDLAEWTIKAQQGARPTNLRGQPPDGAELWLHHYLPRAGHWQRAIGSFKALRDYARDIGQHWVKIRSLHLKH